jgi:hypothetical protein
MEVVCSAYSKLAHVGVAAFGKARDYGSGARRMEREEVHAYTWFETIQSKHMARYPNASANVRAPTHH